MVGLGSGFLLASFLFSCRLQITHISVYFWQMPVWRNGRRDRLKIDYSQGCGGSSPLSGTI